MSLSAPDSPWTLGLRAEDLCLRRMEAIEKRADPADGPLRRLIHDLEDEESAERKQVSSHESPADLCAPASLESEFPSLRDRLGEGPLSRDNALYYLEALKQDAFRFFQKLARTTSDEAARAYFTRLALDAMGQVVRLREMIL